MARKCRRGGGPRLGLGSKTAWWADRAARSRVQRVAGPWPPGAAHGRRAFALRPRRTISTSSGRADAAPPAWTGRADRDSARGLDGFLEKRARGGRASDRARRRGPFMATRLRGLEPNLSRPAAQVATDRRARQDHKRRPRKLTARERMAVASSRRWFLRDRDERHADGPGRGAKAPTRPAADGCHPDVRQGSTGEWCAARPTTSP